MPTRTFTFISVLGAVLAITPASTLANGAGQVASGQGQNRGADLYNNARSGKCGWMQSGGQWVPCQQMPEEMPKGSAEPQAANRQ
jgi:hypothetical protein